MRSALFAVTLCLWLIAASLASSAEPQSKTPGSAPQKKGVPAKSAPKASSGKKKIDGKQACSLVEQRPEVKRWKGDVTKSKTKGVTANIELDREEGDEYVVHVYEDVPDGKDSSHTATFNWYYVNNSTGKIRTEF